MNNNVDPLPTINEPNIKDFKPGIILIIKLYV